MYTQTHPMRHFRPYCHQIKNKYVLPDLGDFENLSIFSLLAEGTEGVSQSRGVLRSRKIPYEAKARSYSTFWRFRGEDTTQSPLYLKRRCTHTRRRGWGEQTNNHVWYVVVRLFSYALVKYWARRGLSFPAHFRPHRGLSDISENHYQKNW